jgi:hypothetical protein
MTETNSKMSNQRICGNCGRFTRCPTGNPKGGKCQDPEGPVYNVFEENEPINEFCWIPRDEFQEKVFNKFPPKCPECGREVCLDNSPVSIIVGKNWGPMIENDGNAYLRKCPHCQTDFKISFKMLIVFNWTIDQVKR